MNWARGFQNMFSNWSEERHEAIKSQREFDRQNRLEESRMLKQKELYGWEKRQEAEAATVERDRRAGIADDQGLVGSNRYNFIEGGQMGATADERETAKKEELGMYKDKLELQSKEELNRLEKQGDLLLTQAKEQNNQQVTMQISNAKELIAAVGENPDTPKGNKMLRQILGFKSQTGIELDNKDMVQIQKEANKATATYMETVTQEEIDGVRKMVKEKKGVTISEADALGLIEKQTQSRYFQSFVGQLSEAFQDPEAIETGEYGGTGTDTPDPKPDPNAPPPDKQETALSQYGVPGDYGPQPQPQKSSFKAPEGGVGRLFKSLWTKLKAGKSKVDAALGTYQGY